ncbi:hypothetical protein T484DRAFT_1762232 [Baffinella frigidus]|nr:hypothetical protein T484DRAFT_1762232 [Cryptophyta sp. CCMP2293]
MRAIRGRLCPNADVLAIADHFDHAVMFGFPLVKQERNPHNYFKDHQGATWGYSRGAL